MNELKIFNNDEFGQIRTVTINNEPWFVAKDVCEVLEHSNTTMAMQMLEDDERTKLSLGRAGATNVVNESGLYTLIIKSNKPSAKKFRKWITSEVLPSIRKTGTYSVPQTTAGQIQLLAQGHMELEQQIEDVKQDLQEFKQDMPLLAVECEKITRAVKAKGVEVLGGKNSNAYRDNSLRSKVYQDIHNEVKRQFGVNTYKAIKRSQCDRAIEIIENYELPMVLADEVADCNAQLNMQVTA